MANVTLSSREFNQDTARAKRAARQGPVVITDRGRSAYVLMTYEEYRRLSEPGRPLIEALAQRDEGDFDFEPPLLDIRVKPLQPD